MRPAGGKGAPRLTNARVTVQMDSMDAFRPIPPQIGITGWSTEIKGHPLPTGLKADTKLTVASLDDTGDRIVVQDQNGSEWSLPSLNVDCGYEFEYFGHWIEEWRPGLLNCLERELVSEFAETQSEELRQIRQEAWAMKQKILARNGRSIIKERHRLSETMQMAVAC